MSRGQVTMYVLLGLIIIILLVLALTYSAKVQLLVNPGKANADLLQEETGFTSQAIKEGFANCLAKSITHVNESPFSAGVVWQAEGTVPLFDPVTNPLPSEKIVLQRLKQLLQNDVAECMDSWGAPEGETNVEVVSTDTGLTIKADYKIHLSSRTSSFNNKLTIPFPLKRYLRELSSFNTELYSHGVINTVPSDPDIQEFLSFQSDDYVQVAYAIKGADLIEAAFLLPPEART